MKRQNLLQIALVSSLALNAWLVSKLAAADVEKKQAAERAAATSTKPNASPAPAAAASNDAPADSVTALAKLIERVPPAPKADTAGGAAAQRVVVDAKLMHDAQCRVAIEKATWAFRKEGPNIQKALLQTPPSEETKAKKLKSATEQLADVLNRAPDDDVVKRLAERRTELQHTAEIALREKIASDPPDWQGGLDVVMQLYRDEDKAGREIAGDDAEDVRLAESETRAAILAIGASLVGVPWESVALP